MKNNAFSAILFAAATGAALPFAASAATDVPVVSNIRLEQPGKTLIVSYNLSQAPAVVTMEILTNGVPMAESSQAFFEGDVNRYVAPGNGRQIRFKPADVLPEDTLFPNTTVRIKAWNVEAPPDYMVVGLGSPSTVRYYVSTNALPLGGLADDWYRTNAIVLRRIHAAGVRWGMGALAREVEDMRSKPSHPVALSEDYYIGVFETTQAQQLLAYGNRGSEETGYADSDVMPAHSKRRYLRPFESWWKLDNNEFDGNWVVSTFRNRTGIKFDLPTDAQWEYACRCGSPYALSLGDIVTLPQQGGAWHTAEMMAILDRTAWYYGNSDGHSHKVGTKEPNDWGLYDMRGNVAEWVLDYVSAGANFNLDEELDPAGPSVAELNADGDILFSTRGGYYGADQNNFGYQVKNSSRFAFQSWHSDRTGYRLVAPVRATATGAQ